MSFSNASWLHETGVTTETMESNPRHERVFPRERIEVRAVDSDMKLTRAARFMVLAPLSRRECVSLTRLLGRNGRLRQQS